MIFFNWQTEKQNCFVPIRSLFSFSTSQTEKNSWKKLGKSSTGPKCFGPVQKQLFTTEFQISNHFHIQGEA